MNLVLVLLFKKIDWVEIFNFLFILRLIFRRGSIEKGSIAQVRAYGGREALIRLTLSKPDFTSVGYAYHNTGCPLEKKSGG